VYKNLDFSDTKKLTTLNFGNYPKAFGGSTIIQMDF